MQLQETPNGLTLILTQGDETKQLTIDFSTTQLQQRCQRAKHQGDPLFKALGLKPAAPQRILDGTAGLGQDAFLLASQGHHVTLIERDRWLHALLADALVRAQAHPDLAPIVARMSLQAMDTGDYLQEADPVDVIYLDPMFPARKKTALAKGPMMLLKHLLDQSEQPALLSAALPVANRRVVVKRPKHAPYLSDKTPSFSQRYQSCRFDVYLTPKPIKTD